GVMNTDNMAISGETLDYGPCAFMDAYHPAAVFSSIDTYGRYAYENQPNMAVWNLARFAETLLPILHDDENEAVNLAQEEIASFRDVYKGHWLAGMRAKLGLHGNEAEDEVLIEELLQLMQQYRADYTNTFRSLTLDKKDDADMFFRPEFHYWNDRRQARLERQAKSTDENKALMKSHNPAVIPRNHRVEEVLGAAENGDFSMLDKFLHALNNPYGYTYEQEEYAKLPEPTSCRYQTFCGT
ncbi:MAG: protein adenylyltransferase SelO family protein, partial [Desulfovibrionaceae bacterium]|nr:protein adenylyltransferase SelO family protein [Desulfovibrionaceae bacterium]